MKRKCNLALATCYLSLSLVLASEIPASNQFGNNVIPPTVESTTQMTTTFDVVKLVADLQITTGWLSTLNATTDASQHEEYHAKLIYHLTSWVQKGCVGISDSPCGVGGLNVSVNGHLTFTTYSVGEITPDNMKESLQMIAPYFNVQIDQVNSLTKTNFTEMPTVLNYKVLIQLQQWNGAALTINTWSDETMKYRLMAWHLDLCSSLTSDYCMVHHPMIHRPDAGQTGVLLDFYLQIMEHLPTAEIMGNVTQTASANHFTTVLNSVTMKGVKDIVPDMMAKVGLRLVKVETSTLRRNDMDLMWTGDLMDKTSPMYMNNSGDVKTWVLAAFGMLPDPTMALVKDVVFSASGSRVIANVNVITTCQLDTDTIDTKLTDASGTGIQTTPQSVEKYRFSGLRRIKGNITINHIEEIIDYEDIIAEQRHMLIVRTRDAPRIDIYSTMHLDNMNDGPRQAASSEAQTGNQQEMGGEQAMLTYMVPPHIKMMEKRTKMDKFKEWLLGVCPKMKGKICDLEYFYADHGNVTFSLVIEDYYLTEADFSSKLHETNDKWEVINFTVNSLMFLDLEGLPVPNTYEIKMNVTHMYNQSVYWHQELMYQDSKAYEEAYTVVCHMASEMCKDDAHMSLCRLGSVKFHRGLNGSIKAKFVLESASSMNNQTLMSKLSSAADMLNVTYNMGDSQEVDPSKTHDYSVRFNILSVVQAGHASSRRNEWWNETLVKMENEKDSNLAFELENDVLLYVAEKMCKSMETSNICSLQGIQYSVGPAHSLAAEITLYARAHYMEKHLRSKFKQSVVESLRRLTYDYVEVMDINMKDDANFVTLMHGMNTWKRDRHGNRLMVSDGHLTMKDYRGNWMSMNQSGYTTMKDRHGRQVSVDAHGHMYNASGHLMAMNDTGMMKMMETDGEMMTMRHKLGGRRRVAAMLEGTAGGMMERGGQMMRKACLMHVSVRLMKLKEAIMAWSTELENRTSTEYRQIRKMVKEWILGATKHISTKEKPMLTMYMMESVESGIGINMTLKSFERIEEDDLTLALKAVGEKMAVMYEIMEIKRKSLPYHKRPQYYTIHGGLKVDMDENIMIHMLMDFVHEYLNMMGISHNDLMYKLGIDMMGMGPKGATGKMEKASKKAGHGMMGMRGAGMHRAEYDMAGKRVDAHRRQDKEMHLDRGLHDMNHETMGRSRNIMGMHGLSMGEARPGDDKPMDGMDRMDDDMFIEMVEHLMAYEMLQKKRGATKPDPLIALADVLIGFLANHDKRLAREFGFMFRGDIQDMRDAHNMTTNGTMETQEDVMNMGHLGMLDLPTTDSGYEGSMGLMGRDAHLYTNNDQYMNKMSALDVLSDSLQQKLREMYGEDGVEVNGKYVAFSKLSHPLEMNRKRNHMMMKGHMHEWILQTCYKASQSVCRVDKLNISSDHTGEVEFRLIVGGGQLDQAKFHHVLMQEAKCMHIKFHMHKLVIRQMDASPMFHIFRLTLEYDNVADKPMMFSQELANVYTKTYRKQSEMLRKMAYMVCRNITHYLCEADDLAFYNSSTGKILANVTFVIRETYDTNITTASVLVALDHATAEMEIRVTSRVLNYIAKKSFPRGSWPPLSTFRLVRGMAIIRSISGQSWLSLKGQVRTLGEMMEDMAKNGKGMGASGMMGGASGMMGGASGMMGGASGMMGGASGMMGGDMEDMDVNSTLMTALVMPDYFYRNIEHWIMDSCMQLDRQGEVYLSDVMFYENDENLMVNFTVKTNKRFRMEELGVTLHSSAVPLLTVETGIYLQKELMPLKQDPFYLGLNMTMTIKLGNAGLVEYLETMDTFAHQVVVHDQLEKWMYTSCHFVSQALCLVEWMNVDLTTLFNDHMVQVYTLVLSGDMKMNKDALLDAMRQYGEIQEIWIQDSSVVVNRMEMHKKGHPTMEMFHGSIDFTTFGNKPVTYNNSLLDYTSSNYESFSIMLGAWAMKLCHNLTNRLCIADDVVFHPVTEKVTFDFSLAAMGDELTTEKLTMAIGHGATDLGISHSIKELVHLGTKGLPMGNWKPLKEDNVILGQALLQSLAGNVLVVPYDREGKKMFTKKIHTVVRDWLYKAMSKSLLPGEAWVEDIRIDPMGTSYVEVNFSIATNQRIKKESMLMNLALAARQIVMEYSLKQLVQRCYAKRDMRRDSNYGASGSMDYDESGMMKPGMKHDVPRLVMFRGGMRLTHIHGQYFMWKSELTNKKSKSYQEMLRLLRPWLARACLAVAKKCHLADLRFTKQKTAEFVLVTASHMVHVPKHFHRRSYIVGHDFLHSGISYKPYLDADQKLMLMEVLHLDNNDEKLVKHLSLLLVRGIKIGGDQSLPDYLADVQPQIEEILEVYLPNRTHSGMLPSMLFNEVLKETKKELMKRVLLQVNGNTMGATVRPEKMSASLFPKNVSSDQMDAYMRIIQGNQDKDQFFRDFVRQVLNSSSSSGSQSLGEFLDMQLKVLGDPLTERLAELDMDEKEFFNTVLMDVMDFMYLMEEKGFVRDRKMVYNREGVFRPQEEEEHDMMAEEGLDYIHDDSSMHGAGMQAPKLPKAMVQKLMEEYGVAGMAEDMMKMMGMHEGMMDGMNRDMDGMNRGMMDGMKRGMMDGMNEGMLDGMHENTMDGMGQDDMHMESYDMEDYDMNNNYDNYFYEDEMYHKDSKKMKHDERKEMKAIPADRSQRDKAYFMEETYFHPSYFNYDEMFKLPSGGRSRRMARGGRMSMDKDDMSMDGDHMSMYGDDMSMEDDDMSMKDDDMSMKDDDMSMKDDDMSMEDDMSMDGDQMSMDDDHMPRNHPSEEGDKKRMMGGSMKSQDYWGYIEGILVDARFPQVWRRSDQGLMDHEVFRRFCRRQKKASLLNWLECALGRVSGKPGHKGGEWKDKMGDMKPNHTMAHPPTTTMPPPVPEAMMNRSKDEQMGKGAGMDRQMGEDEMNRELDEAGKLMREHAIKEEMQRMHREVHPTPSTQEYRKRCSRFHNAQASLPLSEALYCSLNGEPHHMQHEIDCPQWWHRCSKQEWGVYDFWWCLYNEMRGVGAGCNPVDGGGTPMVQHMHKVVVAHGWHGRELMVPVAVLYQQVMMRQMHKDMNMMGKHDADMTGDHMEDDHDQMMPLTTTALPPTQRRRKRDMHERMAGGMHENMAGDMHERMAGGMHESMMQSDDMHDDMMDGPRKMYMKRRSDPRVMPRQPYVLCDKKLSMMYEQIAIENGERWPERPMCGTMDVMQADLTIMARGHDTVMHVNMEKGHRQGKNSDYCAEKEMYPTLVLARHPKDKMKEQYGMDKDMEKCMMEGGADMEKCMMIGGDMQGDMMDGGVHKSMMSMDMMGKMDHMDVYVMMNPKGRWMRGMGGGQGAMIECGKETMDTMKMIKKEKAKRKMPGDGEETTAYLFHMVNGDNLEHFFGPVGGDKFWKPTHHIPKPCGREWMPSKSMHRMFQKPRPAGGLMTSGEEHMGAERGMEGKAAMMWNDVDLTFRAKLMIEDWRYLMKTDKQWWQAYVKQVPASVDTALFLGMQTKMTEYHAKMESTMTDIQNNMTLMQETATTHHMEQKVLYHHLDNLEMMALQNYAQYKHMYMEMFPANASDSWAKVALANYHQEKLERMVNLLFRYFHLDMENEHYLRLYYWHMHLMERIGLNMLFKEDYDSYLSSEEAVVNINNDMALDEFKAIVQMAHDASDMVYHDYCHKVKMARGFHEIESLLNWAEHEKAEGDSMAYMHVEEWLAKYPTVSEKFMTALESSVQVKHNALMQDLERKYERVGDVLMDMHWDQTFMDVQHYLEQEVMKEMEMNREDEVLQTKLNLLKESIPGVTRQRQLQRREGMDEEEFGHQLGMLAEQVVQAVLKDKMDIVESHRKTNQGLKMSKATHGGMIGDMHGDMMEDMHEDMMEGMHEDMMDQTELDVKVMLRIQERIEKMHKKFEHQWMNLTQDLLNRNLISNSTWVMITDVQDMYYTKYWKIVDTFKSLLEGSNSPAEKMRHFKNREKEEDMLIEDAEKAFSELLSKIQGLGHLGVVEALTQLNHAQNKSWQKFSEKYSKPSVGWALVFEAAFKDLKLIDMKDMKQSSDRIETEFDRAAFNESQRVNAHKVLKHMHHGVMRLSRKYALLLSVPTSWEEMLKIWYEMWTKRQHLVRTGHNKLALAMGLHMSADGNWLLDFQELERKKYKDYAKVYPVPRSMTEVNKMTKKQSEDIEEQDLKEFADLYKAITNPSHEMQLMQQVADHYYEGGLMVEGMHMDMLKLVTLEVQEKFVAHVVKTKRSQQGQQASYQYYKLKRRLRASGQHSEVLNQLDAWDWRRFQRQAHAEEAIVHAMTTNSLGWPIHGKEDEEGEEKDGWMDRLNEFDMECLDKDWWRKLETWTTMFGMVQHSMHHEMMADEMAGRGGMDGKIANDMGEDDREMREMTVSRRRRQAMMGDSDSSESVMNNFVEPRGGEEAYSFGSEVPEPNYYYMEDSNPAPPEDYQYVGGSDAGSEFPQAVPMMEAAKSEESEEHGRQMGHWEGQDRKHRKQMAKMRAAEIGAWRAVREMYKHFMLQHALESTMMHTADEYRIGFQPLGLYIVGPPMFKMHQLSFYLHYLHHRRVQFQRFMTDPQSKSFMDLKNNIEAWLVAACQMSHPGVCLVQEVKFSNQGMDTYLHVHMITGADIDESMMEHELNLIGEEEAGIIATLINKKMHFVRELPKPMMESKHVFVYTGHMVVTSVDYESARNLWHDELTKIKSPKFREYSSGISELFNSACNELSEMLCKTEVVSFEWTYGMQVDFKVYTGRRVNKNALYEHIMQYLHEHNVEVSDLKLNRNIKNPITHHMYIGHMKLMDDQGQVMKYLRDLEAKASQQFRDLHKKVRNLLISACHKSSTGRCDLERFVLMQDMEGNLIVHFKLLSKADSTMKTLKIALRTVARKHGVKIEMGQLDLMKLMDPPKELLFSGNIHLSISPTIVRTGNAIKDHHRMLKKLKQWIRAACQQVSDGKCLVRSVDTHPFDKMHVAFDMLTGDQMTETVLINGLNMTRGYFDVNFKNINLEVKDAMGAAGRLNRRRKSVKGRLNLKQLGGQPMQWSDALMDPTSQLYQEMRRRLENMLFSGCMEVSSGRCEVFDVIFSRGSVKVDFDIVVDDDLPTDDLMYGIEYAADSEGIEYEPEGLTERMITTEDERPTSPPVKKVFSGLMRITKLDGTAVQWTSAMMDKGSDSYMNTYQSVEDWLLSACMEISLHPCNLTDLHFTSGSVVANFTLQADNTVTSDNLMAKITEQGRYLDHEYTIEGVSEEQIVAGYTTTWYEYEATLHLMSVTGMPTVWSHDLKNPTTPAYNFMKTIVTNFLVTSTDLISPKILTVDSVNFTEAENSTAVATIEMRLRRDIERMELTGAMDQAAQELGISHILLGLRLLSVEEDVHRSIPLAVNIPGQYPGADADMEDEDMEAASDAGTTQTTTVFVMGPNTRVLGDKFRIISVGGNQLVYSDAYQDLNTPEYKQLHEAMQGVLMAAVGRLSTTPAQELQMTFRDSMTGIIMDLSVVVSQDIQNAEFRDMLAEEAAKRNIILEVEQSLNSDVWQVLTRRPATTVAATTARAPVTETQPQTTIATTTTTMRATPTVNLANLEESLTTAGFQNLPEESPELANADNGSGALLILTWLQVLLLILSSLFNQLNL